MMVFSIIQKSQLAGAQRLDAEYYRPENLAFANKLNNFPTVYLKDVAYITDGEHGSPIFDENSGIKYFSAQHVRDCLIDGSDAKTISKLIDDKNKRSRLQAGDVLISTVGTVGFAALITRELLPANIDRHVARIALKTNTIDPEFLVAFLNSSYGKFQSTRESTGNVQLNLFIDKIKELKVPKINNSYIAELIKNALSELKSSEDVYSQAENLLLEELGLSNFKIEDDLSYVVNFSDNQVAKRIDAEFFQTKYEKLTSKIENKNSPHLSDLISDYSTGFPFKSDNYQDNGIPLIRINNIKKGYLDLSDTAYLSEKDFSLSPKDTAKFGDIVLSMSGTIGMCSSIPSNIQKCSINQRILRFTPKDINSDYLVLLLNSIVGSYQLEKIGTGGVQTNISYKDIKDILLPILPKPTQQKIADLVRQSHEARKKSKELLEEAKRKVEEMIEKGNSYDVKLH